MNFQNLEYFTVVAKEQSITKAAERLHISQQGLSNQILRLESELGCTLFDRKQNLELTYSGKQFLESAERILDISRQTANAINDINANRRGALRLGISHTRGQAILPLILPQFSKKYPLVELSVTEGSTHVLEKDLQNGLIDVLIGFAPFMVECAQFTELMRERLFLVVPDSLLHEKYGDKADLMLERFMTQNDPCLFKDLPFVLLKEGDRIRTLVDNEMHRLGIKPTIKIETTNIQTAFALASEGMGLSVCPELYLQTPYVVSGSPNSFARQRVHLARFFSSDIQDTIAIGYNKDRYLSKIASDFIETSIECFKAQPPIH